jgi:hypothetical protein
MKKMLTLDQASREHRKPVVNGKIMLNEKVM